MIIDITEPQDTVQMSTYHTYLQDAKTQIAERMEANSSGSVYEHNEHDSSDFGIHNYNSQFAREHVDLPTLQAYTPKVNGSMHVELDTPAFYSIESGALVQLSFLDHATLKNLDDTLHNADYFSAGGSITLESDVTILDGGSLTPSAQVYTADDDPLDPDHVAKTHYEAHGAASVDNAMLIDDAYDLATASPYYQDPSAGVDFRTFHCRDTGVSVMNGARIYMVSSGYAVSTFTVNEILFCGSKLSTVNGV